MSVLDVIFPKKCALCKEPVSSGSGYLCTGCQQELPVMKHVCAIRDLPVYEGKTLSVYCALRYTGMVKKGIVSMKYGDRPQVADFLGDQLYEVLAESRLFAHRFADFDCIIPVPATEDKIRMRGYNQAELIAKQVARRAGLPVLNGVLIKNANVASQSTMDLAARQKSVAGIYEAGDSSSIQGRRLILVDDILTTGATAIACAKILYQSGADQVIAITASTGKKDV